MHEDDDDDDHNDKLSVSTARTRWVATQETHTFHLSHTSQTVLIGAVSKTSLAELDSTLLSTSRRKRSKAATCLAPPVLAPVAPPPPRLWHCARDAPLVELKVLSVMAPAAGRQAVEWRRL